MVLRSPAARRRQYARIAGELVLHLTALALAVTIATVARDIAPAARAAAACSAVCVEGAAPTRQLIPLGE